MRSAGVLIACVAACGGGGGNEGETDAAPETDACAGLSADDLFDPTRVHRWEVTVAAADWDRINADPRAEEYVPADVRWGEHTVARAAIRYKGGVGSLRLCFDAQGNRTCPKLSMKLRFDEYVDGQRFAGLKRINFHAMMRDASHMKDRIGYGLFRAAGVPAPRAAHARLSVNGEDLGLFALVEEIDGEFVEDHFRAVDGSGEGNLYKEVWPIYGTPAPYVNALDTNEEAAAVDKMVRFAGALQAATPATFGATVDTWLERDAWISYHAVDRLIDSWDGILAWYCSGQGCRNHNFFWYEEVGRDRMWLIPWDLDNTMQVPSLMRDSYGVPDWNASRTDCAPRQVFLGLTVRPPACDPLIGLTAETMWGAYEARTAELLAGPASAAALEAEMAAIEALLEPEVTTDAFGPGLAAWRQAVAKLRADLPTLRARVAP